MSRVVVEYIADTSDLVRARRELGFIGDEQEGLVNEFRRVNAEAEKQADALKKIGKEGQEAGKKAGDGIGSIGKIAMGVGGLIAGAFAVDRIIAFTQNVVKTTAEFQKYAAVLTNTLGSRSQAMQAMGMIQSFAAKTPYGVAELTGSFVKLANMGMKPTQEEMRKLGDLAASTGKGFDQLSEAIIDAGTFEFERLKEFGIRAHKHGDEVTFTFKGVETTVKATSGAIQDYVKGLGDVVGVSGSMAAISGTVGGQLSNLDDSFDRLFLSIGNGIQGPVSGLIGTVNDLVNGLADLIESEDAVINKSLETVAANQAQATSAQSLLDRYLELTKDGVQPTGKAKQELDAITLQLKDTLGDSVIAIDKETGAFSLNVAAAKEAIKAKLLLANQEAGTLALRINKYNEDITAQQTRLATERRMLETRKEMLKAFGFTEEEIANNSYLLSSRMTKENSKASAAYNNSIREIMRGEGNLKELEADRAELLSKLNALGFDQADVERLFTAALKAGEETKKKEQETLGLLEAARKRLKEATEAAEKAQTKVAIAEAGVRIDKAKKEVEALEELLKVRELANVELPKPAGVTPEDYKNYLAGLNELDQAAADKKKAIDTDYTTWAASVNAQAAQRDLDEAKRVAQGRRDYFMQAGTEMFSYGVEFANLLFDHEAQKLAERQDNLAADRDYQLKLAGNNAAEKTRIEKEFTEKDKALKKEQAETARKQAILNKAISIANIAMKTAETVMSIMSTGGGTYYTDFGISAGIQVGIALALGAAQVATVVAQPIPKYAKGTRNVKGGTPGVDSVLAYLMPGEGIMPTDINQEYSGVLDKIYNRQIPAELLNNIAVNYGGGLEFKGPSTKMLQYNPDQDDRKHERLLKAIANQPRYNSIMEDGEMKTYIEKNGGRTEVLNARYSTF